MAKISVSLQIYSKFSKFCDKFFVRSRREKLNNTDFSVICNNCWGGYVYRRYGLPYLTPTVGLYFFSGDYVKLCRNLRRYMETPLVFIPYTESKYRDIIEERRQQNIPIGKLDDVEVFFLHYKSEEEAREKWERRAKRINYDNLIFKFSKMNFCSDEDLLGFDALEGNKKICFVPPEERGIIKCAVPFKSAAGKREVSNDTSEYARYLNLTKMINAKHVCGTKME